ncbi:MAG: hdfR 3 [Firmicutes bacterium]|nr:hdfR 3 [Bacillota bacterium]
MDDRQLRSFTCVAERLNFTEAARHLYLTQSTVSQHVADLEKQLKVQLFVRTTHKVELTAAGEVFLKEAYAILAKSEEAINKTRRTAAGVAGNLRVGFLESTVGYFLPQVISNYCNRYPNIALQLNCLYWEELNKALLNNDIDLGLTISFAINNVPGLTSRSVYKDKLSVVMPHNHLLANNKEIDLSEMANESFISLSPIVAPMPVYVTYELCAKRNFVPNMICQPELHETILLMIQAGLGVAILPYFMKFIASSNLSFVDFVGDDHYLSVVVVWKTSNNNPAIPLFLRELNQIEIPRFNNLDEFK